jgi:hypothetical protein
MNQADTYIYNKSLLFLYLGVLLLSPNDLFLMVYKTKKDPLEGIPPMGLFATRICPTHK